MNYLLEDRRNDLVTQGKRGEREKIDGKTRYEKRVKSRIASTVKEYNQIDMQSLYKYNILTVQVPVVGETDNYLVRIKFGSFLDVLKDQIDRQNGKLDLRAVTRALLEAFNRDDVYIFCNCLHPSTKIKLLDGTSPTIEEMKLRFDKGEKLYVYSADENGDFKPGEVEKVWITKTTSDFIKITLDNDEELITTPDHPYMLRDGTYKQAQNLSIGQSLMPLYTSINAKGYELIKLNSQIKGRNTTYKLVADYYKKDEIEQTKLRVKPEDNMKYDVAIHHIDFNKLNNNPENLQIMTAREHWDYHAKNCKKHWETPGFREKTIASLSTPEHGEKISKAYWAKSEEERAELNERKRINHLGKHNRKKSKEECEKISINNKNKHSIPCSDEKKLNIGNGIKRAYKNFTQEQWELKSNNCKSILCNEENTKKRKEGLKNYYDSLRHSMTEEEFYNYWSNLRKNKPHILKNPEKAKSNYREAALKRDNKERMLNYFANLSEEEKIKRIQKIKLSKISRTIQTILDNKEIVSEDTYIKYGSGKGKIPWDSYFSSFEDLIKYFNLNHKVKNIEYITLPNTPVYDIKVKDWHNFATAAGVYLHNCPDWKYRMGFWASVSNINSGPPERRPSKITNPKNTLGPGCKHVMLVLANSSWLIKVASVIWNYINYMEKHQKKLYADLMYPAIYGKKYEEPVQLSIEDEEELADTIGKDTSKIDVANIEGRTRGQFKPGNKYRFKPNERPGTKNQISIEDIETEEN